MKICGSNKHEVRRPVQFKQSVRSVEFVSTGDGSYMVNKRLLFLFIHLLVD